VVSIAVVGNVNVDLLAWPVADVPPPGTERPIERIDVRVGGGAAIASAALTRLGTDPVLVGCVGLDGLGRIALDELRRYGVDTGAMTQLDGATTGASIAIEAPGRDRSFLIALGSLASFGPAMIPDRAIGASLLLLTGYFNVPGMRGTAARRLLEAVRSRGGTTLLDTGWDHDDWPASTREEIASLLPLVDVFLPNEYEAERLSGERDPERAAAALARSSGGWVAVKLGGDGALAAAADGQTIRVGAPRLEIVDTTGAGDAFNAGLIDAIARGAGPGEALPHAVAVASTVVARPSRDRYPTRGEVVPLPAR
jgi:sugar/nucleoside kinase (ribokinase family)